MKRVVFTLLYLAGVTRFAAWWNRKRVIFVCYHGVTKSAQRSPTDTTGLHVNHRRFANQLDFLAKRYAFISLGEYLSARQDGRRLPDYSILLTFDDGFRNFLTAAAPLLTARRIPATVFLITGHADFRSSAIGDTSWRPEDDSNYLSWSEARLLKEKYQIDFGSHTCSHSPLLSLSPQEIEHELGHSRDCLSRNLAIETPSLSYPKGEQSQMLAEQARKQGYGCAVTTDRGANEFGHDLFTLGRTLVGDADDKFSLAVRISGVRYWLVCIRSLFVSRPELSSVKIEAPSLQTEGSLQLLD